MKYAIVQIGGKQFKVKENTTFKVERQSDVSNIDVLYYSNGADIMVGTPTVKDVTVKASIEGEEKVKTRVARYRSKSRYRKVTGHKQPFSIIKIESILKKGEKSETSTKKTTKKSEESSVKAKSSAKSSKKTSTKVSKENKAKKSAAKTTKKPADKKSTK